MKLLKQSTAATVVVGPVLDANGAAVTTAVVGDFKLAKNGTTATLSGATVTHDANGYYTVALTTGNTDTVGRLAIYSGNTSHAMATHHWTVLLASVFDAILANATNSTGGLVTATGSVTALAGAISTYAGGDTAGTATLLTRLPSAISLAAGAVTVGTNNDKSGYSLTATTGLGNQTANITGNLSGSVGSVTGAVGSVTARVTANTDQWGGVAVTGMPMPTYTQPTGFLAATFPSTVSSYAGGAVASVTGSVGSIAGVTFPAHFNDLEITANGHVSAVVQSIANNSITASSIQGGAITAAKFATDAISAAAIAADAVTEIQSGLATSAAVAAVQSDVTTLLGRITSTLFSGITYLSRWLGALAGKTADASTQTEIRATTAGATYTITTDSLEAIRDNSGGGGGSGDASQTTLLEVQGTVDSIAASLSGTTVSVSSRVSAAGEITLWAGDDCRVRSGTQIDVTITDVGGAIYTRLDGIGIANLAWGAARIVQPAGAITGTIAALTQAGSGASQTLTISIEITDGGSDLRAADDYTWQIVSSEQHGTEYDQQVELEGSLVLRRRVAVPVY
jgi:hypothetical protein